MSTSTATLIANYLDSWAASLEQAAEQQDNPTARANQLRLAATSIRNGDYKKKPTS